MVFFEVKSVEDLTRAGIAKIFNFKSEILIDFNLTYVLFNASWSFPPEPRDFNRFLITTWLN